MLKTYIYHQLPPTFFGVCYTTFRETIALLGQKLYAFCYVAVKCTVTLLFYIVQQHSHKHIAFEQVMQWSP